MHMTFRSILAVALALTISAAAFAAVEIRLKDGSRWRGELNQNVELRITERSVETAITGKLLRDEPLYIIIEGNILGQMRQKTILKSDIVSMKTVGGGEAAPSAPSAPVAPTATPGTSTPSATPTPAPSSTTTSEIPRGPDGRPLAVFYLPLAGMVGLEFRHQEIAAIGKEADKFGPGQIIVFMIESGGGRVDETEVIHKTMVDLRKRHRLVAWIKEAISAACATALHCDEIYFMTEGAAGSMTAFAGTQSWQGKELDLWLQTAGDWAELGGRSRYIAEAMIHAPKLLSYDKDPITGEVTWYNTLQGEFKLSDAKTNLTFNASNALHCGFSDGTADTTEELAKLLDLPRWVEIGDGRNIGERWAKVVKQANTELPKLVRQYGYKGASNPDPAVTIGTRIGILQDLIRWWDRCPNCCEMAGLPPKQFLQREIEELRKRLADMRRNR